MLNLWILIITGFLGCVIFGLCIIFLVYKIQKRQRSFREKAQENKKLRIIALNSSTLRGNLVRTHKTEPIQNDYNIETQQIGKGGCGIVVTGTCKNTQALHAIKIVSKKHADIKRLERELKLLKNVDHTNIVRLFSVYDSPSTVYFVMELCRGGHLGNLLARQTPIHGSRVLTEDWARRLSRQLFSAIAHIHSRGISHRDIKLQNVLLDVNGNDQAQIKLIDFGFGSCYIGALPMRTKCGTLYTTAPEVIRECYDERCDVWSAGVVIFTLLCGKRPFEMLTVAGTLQEASKAAMTTNILAGRYHMKHRTWAKVSKQGISFVKDLLHPNYLHRMTSAEALEHPWLNDTSIQDDNHYIMKSSKSFRAVHNMKNSSKANSALKMAGSTALVFGLQPNSATDLRGVFQAMDRDGSGALSLDEFTEAFQILAPELSAEDVKRIFNIIDLDHNELLSYTEFLIAAIDPREVDIDELSNAFTIMDADGNGQISRNEMWEVLRLQHHNRFSQTFDASKPSGESREATSDESQKSTPSSDKLPSPVTSLKSAVGGCSEMPMVPSTKSIEEVSAKHRSSHYTQSELQVEEVEKEIQSQIDQIFDEHDVDKDGTISYAEFLYAMTGLDFYLHKSSFKSKEVSMNSDDEDATSSKFANKLSKQPSQSSQSSEEYDGSDKYDSLSDYPVNTTKPLKGARRTHHTLAKRQHRDSNSRVYPVSTDGCNETSKGNTENSEECVIRITREGSGDSHQSHQSIEVRLDTVEHCCDEEQSPFNLSLKPPALSRENSRKSLGVPDSPIPLFRNKHGGVGSLVRQSSVKSIQSEHSDVSDLVDDDIESRSGFSPNCKHLFD